MISPKYLELCYKLRSAPIEFSISFGSRVARGYADVGFEEFAVLQNSKMVSLSSGRVHDLDLEHVFAVPSLEELLQVIPAHFRVLVESRRVFINGREYDSLEIGLLRELLTHFGIEAASPRLKAV
jgi:hypothetical protein